MKSLQFKTGLILMALFAVLFVGCNKEEEKLLDPTISFEGGAGLISADATVDSASTIRIKVIAQKGKDGAKLKQFKVTKAVTGATQTITDSTLSSASDETFNYTLQDIANVAATYTFTITDKDGKTATKSIKITLTTGPVITKPTVSNWNFTTTLCFFNGSAVIDSATAAGSPSTAYFRYYNSGATGTTLISAANLATAAYNGTAVYSAWATATAEFRTLSITATEFDALKDQDKANLVTTFNNGTKVTADANNPAGTRANNLATGNLLGIQCGGKTYIVKVTATSQTSLALEVLN